MSFLSFIIVLGCLTSKYQSAYTYSNDLQENIEHSGWYDTLNDVELEVQYDDKNNIQFIGDEQIQNEVSWSKQYSLQNIYRLQVYFEYQISGITEDQELIIFGNNQIVFYQHLIFDSITLQQGNKFQQQVYFQINQPDDVLILKIKINKTNLNFYIYNILLNLYQREYPQTYIYKEQYNPTCDSGLFFQDYCQCSSSLFFEISQCVTQCSSGSLTSTIDQECYKKNNCDACSTDLLCNKGYLKLNQDDSEKSNCVAKCPGNTLQFQNSCIDLVEYLQETENNGYTIDHFAFFTSVPIFLHFFSQNQFIIDIKTIPTPIDQKQFYFQNGRFCIGTNEPFQSQTITLTVHILQSQYKLRFRAIGNFVGFQAAKNEVTINKIKQPASEIQLYQTQYDYVWEKEKDSYPLNENVIIFTIEQPMINGKYQGLFYLDEIYLFSYECMPGCSSCHTAEYCTPCTNPNHKNPSDCTCIKGYILVNDNCEVCPTYCVTCIGIQTCSSCVVSTNRINPPSCNTCVDGYYVQNGIDECQPCNPLCRQCQNGNECISCKYSLFRNNVNQCGTECGDGYYKDLTNINDLKCSLCDTLCITCKDDSQTCTSCRQYEVLLNNKCFKCPVGSYFLISSCQPCSDNCERCTANKCILCLDSFYYYQNQCIQECPIGYLQNESQRKCEQCDITCQTCRGGNFSDCLTCQQNKVMNWIGDISGECLEHCRDGYYKNDLQCSKCWIGCQQCIDNTQQCLKCAKLYYRYNNICQDNCPDGYYKDKIQMTCNKCHDSCKTCLNYEYCLTCPEQLALQVGECVKECKDGYGNINQICQQCTNNCQKCFGIDANQCLQCNKGFYFLNNQCYWKCPINYNSIRPQYVCKCQYEDECVTCNGNEYYLNNVCYNECPQRYYGYNGLCIKCDPICLTCYGEQSDQCLSCQQDLILFQSQCITQCLGNTYHDIQSNQCKYCHQDCLSCNGPMDNNCTACQNQLLLSQEGQCNNYCPDNQYPVLQEYRCYQCHNSCLTCFSKSYQNCQSCTNYFYLYECVNQCPDGFQISPNKRQCVTNNIQLLECSYQCQTCEYIPRFCKSCTSNRVSNPPFCDCENGYYDDGINSLCQKCSNKCSSCKNTPNYCLICKGDRLLPNCDCPKYSYDDNQSVLCNKCQDNCETCNQNGCITCLNNRINPPSCICQNGYFEEYKSYCTECEYQCETCITSALYCLTCKSLRINPPLCQCPNGYFNNSDNECQQCNPICKECSFLGCVMCYGNRVGPNDGVCTCDTPGYNRIEVGSYYCTDCQIGVPSFTLNDDFLGFKIDFGGPFTQLFYECSKIFDQQTLNVLGNNPKCTNDAIILFGSNSTITIGHQIQLNKIFKLEGCNTMFSQILQMPLRLPSNIDIEQHKPKLIFQQLNNPSVCQTLSIKILDTLYNANQKIKILSWQILLPKEQNPNIQQILNQNTQNQSYTITFQPQIFQNDVLYKFSVNIQSFALIENVQYFQFIPKLFSVATFKPLRQSYNMFRYQSFNAQGIIEYNNCQETNPPKQVLYYSIIIQNTEYILYQGSIDNNLYDGFTYNVNHSTSPFFFNVSQHYVLEFRTKLVRPDYANNLTYLMDLYVLYTNPIVKILGDNRMVGYDEDLNLVARILDPDTQSNYDCVWQCLDLIQNGDCVSNKNELIIFNSNCAQVIKKKTFQPYQVFFITVSIQKESITFSNKISIQVLELNLPILSVIGPDQSKSHNYYDEILFKLQYPGINPDFLIYAGAVIYDSVVQASFEFFYLELKFKLQDYFTNLNQSNYVRLRLSVYDPRFILPSLNTQILQMNIPPQNCELQFGDIEVIVEFLDKVKFSIVGCQTQSKQLTYSAWLFPNESIYNQDLKYSYFHHYLTLSQNQHNSEFNLQFSHQCNGYLVILIQDDKGGISNITKQLDIKSYKLSQQIFNTFISEKQYFDEMLMAYNIVCERLSRLNGLDKYKEQVLSYLTNLSLSGNQSVIQYQAISYLINNSLILQQQSFLIQIQSQINIVRESLQYITEKQKQQLLTSQDNLERELDLKQYYLIVDILSKYLQFKVLRNESSSDILDLLTKIQDSLQNISVANQPIYQIYSDYITTNIGYLTTKRLNSILDTKQAQSNQIYGYQFTRFKSNPYYSESGFPKNSSGYEAFNPRIVNSTHNVSSVNSSLKYSFQQDKTLPNNLTLVCITQINFTNWNSRICKTKYPENEVICECETLSPVTVMKSFNDLFNKANQVYSVETLLAFLKYPFYKAVAFYFYLTLTIGYLVIVWWGVRVDNQMFTKIAVHEENMEVKLKIRRNAVNNEQANPILQKTDSNVINTSPDEVLKDHTILKKPIQQNQQLQIKNLIKQPNISVLYEEPKIIKQLSQWQQYIQFVKYFHQILSIYYKDDSTQPRGLRASVLYTSIIGSLAMHFLFNNSDISFNIAIMCIVAPLNKVYQWILQKGLSHKRKGLRSLCIGVMIIVAAYISYTMLAGLLLNSSLEEANKWSGIFVGSFCLDNFVYSPIQLFCQQRVMVWLLNHKRFWKYGKRIVDEKGRELIKQLYN